MLWVGLVGVDMPLSVCYLLILLLSVASLVGDKVAAYFYTFLNLCGGEVMNKKYI